MNKPICKVESVANFDRVEAKWWLGSPRSGRFTKKISHKGSRAFGKKKIANYLQFA